MAQEKNNNTADRELFLSRLVNAPVALVWEIWTNPEHIGKWWGPQGFTNTIRSMDFRVGGTWEFTMHGPDGTDYPNKKIFTEIIPRKRIVFDHISVPGHTTTVTFTAQGDKTLLTWYMLFESREQFELAVKTFKADQGLRQNVDKLAAYAENMLQ